MLNLVKSQLQARQGMPLRLYKSQAQAFQGLLLYAKSQMSIGFPTTRYIKSQVQVFEKSILKLVKSQASVFTPVSLLSWEYAKIGVSDISWDIRAGSHDISDLPISLTVNLNLSSPATASLDFVDHDMSICPLYPGTLQNVLDERPLTATLTTPKEMRAVVNWGGRSFRYYFLGKSFSYSREQVTKVTNLSWQLIDHSLKWAADYQSASTVRSTRKKTYTNTEELSYLCSAYNIEYNLSGVSRSYIIPLQNRQSSRPMDWMTEIVQDGLLDDWVFLEGKTFYPFYPNLGSYQDVVDFYTDVLEEEGGADWSNIYNHIVVSRAVEATAHLDSTNTEVGGVVEVNNYGEYEFSFSEPVFNPQFHVESAAKGIFSDYRWRDLNKKTVRLQDARTLNPLLYGDAFTNGGPMTAIGSVKFTWGIPNGIVGLTGDYGRIRFTGTPYASLKQWGGEQLPKTDESTETNPLPSLRAEAISSSSQALFGIKRMEVPANPIIATKEQAQLIADRTLTKYAFSSRHGSVKIYLRPSIVPGMVLLEKVHRASTYRSVYTRRRLVVNVEHKYSMNPEDRYTKYEGILLE